MARPLRIEFPEAWYHVMNRGRRGEKIFEDEKDYHAFVGLLEESSGIWGVRVSAYCLMSNHYHLLLQTPEANLSRFMRHVDGVYTQRFNRRHKVDGQLFRGRYKSILVDEDSYLLELLRYIHRNPVRAGLVVKLEDYPWSSHAAYLSERRAFGWLHKEFMLAIFSIKKDQAKREYRKFVTLEEPEEIKDLFGRKNLPAILGSEAFISWVKEKFSTRKRHPQVPESRRLAPAMERIIEVICGEYGIGPEDLIRTRRGYFNEPRNVAIYLSRVIAGEPLIKIGERFRLSNYSSVSSITARMKSRLQSDKAFQKRVEKIKSRL
jgi:putative transposase